MKFAGRFAGCLLCMYLSAVVPSQAMMECPDCDGGSQGDQGLTAPTAEGESLRTLAWAVALALQDEGLRQRLLNDIRDSRFREHKLEFNSYLHGASGGILLAEMAQRTGMDQAALLSLVEAVRPLEFYFPVPAHQETWSGGADLLVAAQLEKSDLPIGFDLLGHEVPLSPETESATPTVVLVPVETEFAAAAPSASSSSPEAQSSPMMMMMRENDCGAEAIEECGGTGGGGGGATWPHPTGLFFNQMVVRNDHEPWTRGAPELEVWLYGTQVGLWEERTTSCFDGRYHSPFPRKPQYPEDSGLPSCFFGTQLHFYRFNSNATRLVPIGCAGEKAPGYHWFNYDRTGSHVNFTDVYFAEPDKFTILYTAKDKFGLIRDERYVRLRPPFVLEVIERDDGKQCPKGQRKIDLKFEINLLARSLEDAIKISNPLDFLGHLLGNNNDLVSRWIIPSWDELEAFNRTWLYGSNAVRGHADINVGNNRLSRDQIPPEQVPYTDPAPPLLSAIAASGITSTSATITWTTNELSDAQVEYGVGPSYGQQTTLDPALVEAHSQTLTGLAPGTLYHYRVIARDAAQNTAVSGAFTFTTATEFREPILPRRRLPLLR